MRLRAVPERDGDQMVGIRLFGIRPSHPMGRLGFENGDRVERLMGHAMTSPEQSDEALRALEKANVVVVDLVRHGKPMKLAIRVE